MAPRPSIPPPPTRGRFFDPPDSGGYRGRFFDPPDSGGYRGRFFDPPDSGGYRGTDLSSAARSAGRV